VSYYYELKWWSDTFVVYKGT